MTKPGDSQTKKTLHELAKEFPEKTYRELEKYRDADRQEEAEQIPLTESQKSQEKLEPIGIGHNNPPGEDFKKACTLGEMRGPASAPFISRTSTAIPLRSGVLQKGRVLTACSTWVRSCRSGIARRTGPIPIKKAAAERT